MISQAEFDRQRLVRLIWVYFALLIVEGAFRKWFLPSLSNPLMLVRDPVAVLIVALGYRSGRLVFDVYVKSLFLLLGALVALGGIQLVNGVGGSPLVIGYGLRTYVLHVPVAFVMARVLNADDLRRIMLTLLWLALPMALLMAVQFESSPHAWINAGVAGHKGGQIFAAAGRIRPAGTFSYNTGPIALYSLALAALIATYIDIHGVSFAARLSAWVGIILAAAVSGSRSLLASLAVVAVAGLAGWARARSAVLGRGLATAGVTAFVVVSALGAFDTVQEGTEVIERRLRMLDDGGLAERVSYEYNTVRWAILDSPPMGVGLGSGTNAAAAYEGTKGFRWGEGEWPRVIFEAGPLVGILYLLWRVWITIAAGRAALRQASGGVLLPLLLLGACSSNVVTGQWGQTSIQGFGLFTLGLTLAAGRCATAGRLAAARAYQPPPGWMTRQPARARG